MPSDTYPGDGPFTQKIQNLLNKVRSDNMDFPWENHRTGVTRQQLANELAQRHFQGTTGAQQETNAAWLDCPDVNQAALSAAILQALTNPHGFPGPRGWNDWRGRHRGTWYESRSRFVDDASWDQATKERTKVSGDNDSNGQPRQYDFQKVHWPGRSTGSYGWNQSHPDVPYLWGWDPKENGDEHGDIGASVGFPFEFGACKFIIWITSKAVFLECINTGRQDTKRVNGQSVRGYPKAATMLTGGRGQWVVQR